MSQIFQKEIEKIYKNFPIIVLLRHAERFEIEEGIFGNEVQLTKNGEQCSRNLGKTTFYKRIGSIYTSSLLRCQNTAYQLLYGAAQNENEVIDNQILGDPGCFVENSEICGQTFSQMGTINTVLNYINGRELPGFKRIQEGADIMKNFLINHLPNNINAINLAISHDAIIMAFISYVLHYHFTTQNWLNYLEGIIFFKKEKEYFIHFREKLYKL